MILKDKQGTPIQVGDTVVKAINVGRSPMLELRTVREIKDGKLYLDNSKVAINFPNRLIVLLRHADSIPL